MTRTFGRSKRALLITLAAVATVAPNAIVGPARAAGTDHAASSRDRVWQDVSPPKSPSKRVGAAMAYDAATDRTILFGGFVGDFHKSSETWSWDGTTDKWTLRHPAEHPSARDGAVMAYDGARHEVVLFGGVDEDQQYLDDTWVFDGQTWTEVKPEDAPPAASGAAMAYDPRNAEIVYFGGRYGGTWIWAGENWEERQPPVSPENRAGPVMAYNRYRQAVILYGGYNGHAVKTTWAWDGTGWTQLNVGHTATRRPTVGLAMAAFGRRVICFGGSGAKQRGNETWVLGQNEWRMRKFDDPPPGRFGASMAFDSTRKQVVMFGGLTRRGDNRLADTWTLDAISAIPPTP